MVSLARVAQFRLGLSCLVAAGATFGVGIRHADATSPSSKCETTLTCSSGQAALKATSRTRLDTSIDTGWIPSCGVVGQDHCSSHQLQVRANVAIDAPDNLAESLIAIDMPSGAVVDATWPSK